MGKLDIQTLLQVRFHLNPEIFVVPDLFAHGANGDNIPKHHQLADIFQDQNRIVTALKNKGRRGYQNVNLNDLFIPEEFHFFAISDNFSSLKGLCHGVSDNTVGAGRGSTTAIFMVVVMDAMKGFTTPQPENLGFFGSQQRYCGTIIFMDADILIYNKYW